MGVRKERGEKKGVTEFRELKFSVTHRRQKDEQSTLPHSSKRLNRMKTELFIDLLLRSYWYLPREMSKARV